MYPEVYEILRTAYEAIKAEKPNNRSESDRVFAIILTDLEKILAFSSYYLASNASKDE